MKQDGYVHLEQYIWFAQLIVLALFFCVRRVARRLYDFKSICSFFITFFTSLVLLLVTLFYH